VAKVSSKTARRANPWRVKTVSTEAGTRALGYTLAKQLKAGDVVALVGDLGVGKTCLVKSICAYFKIEGMVNSPTFTIVNVYQSPRLIYHLDFYRLKRLAELQAIGIDDYLYGAGICLIEWADNFKKILPASAYRVEMRALGKSRREIKHNVF